MSQKPLIVIDTNVLVAGLRSRQGWSFQLISRIGQGSFDHCVSVPLLLEYEEVLKRMIVEIRLSPAEIDAVLDYLTQTGKATLIYFHVGPVASDRDDQMVLEAAIAAGAECIVTFNVRNFAEARQYGIAVRTPAEFCAEVGITP